MTFLWLLGIHLIALLTPGPDFFLVSSYALKRSFNEAFLVVCGLCLGVLIWVTFSLFGLKLFLQTFPIFHVLLTLLGTLYLFFMSYSLLKNANSPLRLRFDFKSVAFLQGFITNLLNPKAMLYFVSIFSGLDFSHSNLWVIMISIVLETLLYFSTIALLFSRPKVQNFYLKHHQKSDRFCALVFCGFGFYLLWGLWH
ncbi:LysE family transporter [Helicobacter cynogastricus]|uniref:LysE family transporter n=1 Tax=Helicobacter cynogastricus TaxID=329937 RepID=UPI000CF14C88|nr:LysE family transporter [Helicobacter cynogastricus]